MLHKGLAVDRHGSQVCSHLINDCRASLLFGEVGIRALVQRLHTLSLLDLLMLVLLDQCPVLSTVRA